MTVLLWAGVGLLGAVGALARFLVDSLVSARFAGSFPSGILVVNASGALLIGVLAGLTLPGDAWLLAATAALGSYTTFSTWMLDSHRLGERDETGLLFLNIAASSVIGLAAVLFGRAIGGLA